MRLRPLWSLSNRGGTSTNPLGAGGARSLDWEVPMPYLLWYVR